MASHDEEQHKELIDKRVEGRFAGKTVSLRAYADRLVMVSGGTIVGEHERSFERDRTFFNPWHYVEALTG